MWLDVTISFHTTWNAQRAPAVLATYATCNAATLAIYRRPSPAYCTQSHEGDRTHRALLAAQSSIDPLAHLPPPHPHPCPHPATQSHRRSTMSVELDPAELGFRRTSYDVCSPVVQPSAHHHYQGRLHKKCRKCCALPTRTATQLPSRSVEPPDSSDLIITNTYPGQNNRSEAVRTLRTHIEPPTALTNPSTGTVCDRTPAE